MRNTIVLYGSSTGTCQGIAETIAQRLGAVATNISACTKEALENCSNLILGTSTWGSGEMQDDWYEGVELLKGVSLSGKTVALFGCGDGYTYSDTFCGGMRELYDAVKEAGAKVVGFTSTHGYTFDDSAAVVNDMFVGLPLDEDNESDQTEERINRWLSEIQKELV